MDRRVHTEPVVQLLQPSLSCILNWRVEEDDLVLYPDFVDNRLECHMALRKLFTSVSDIYHGFQRQPYLLFFGTFVPSALVGDIPERWKLASTVRVLQTVELGAEHLYRLGQPLEEDPFYPLIEFGDPLFEVGIALQVQTIDLYNDASELV